MYGQIQRIGCNAIIRTQKKLKRAVVTGNVTKNNTFFCIKPFLVTDSKAINNIFRILFFNIGNFTKNLMKLIILKTNQIGIHKQLALRKSLISKSRKNFKHFKIN